MMVLVAAGACASAHAGVKVVEWGPYNVDDNYTVDWYPNGPSIKILGPYYEGQPYEFEVYESETGEPADIYEITSNPYIGRVDITLVGHQGREFGAANVGKIVLDYGQDVDARFLAFRISGALGTLGVESQVPYIKGPFSAATLGGPLAVSVSVAGEGNLIITGQVSPYPALTLRSVVAGGPLGDAVQITANYLGTITLGSVG
jgi:hypothetical protein